MPPINGKSTEPNEPGVLGESTQYNGVLGQTTADGHAGVAGVSDEGNGTGVYGRSKNKNGVYGVSSAAEHSGVVGGNDNGTGVLGRSINSRGVWGLSDNSVGVLAQTRSINTPALQAFQSNPKSNSFALHAKHDGGKIAGFFEGNVEITGSLAVQGVNLIQRIQQLEQQVQMLSSQVSELMRNRPTGGTGGTTATFTIDVTVTQSEVKVTGQGFRPGVKCFIHVVYPDLTRKILEDTAASNGNLNFNTSVSALCVSGLTLTLNFTVNQPDASGRDKFTNTVSKSIRC